MSTPPKKRGRPPARPTDHVAGHRSGVSLNLRVDSELRTRLDEERRRYNNEHNLNVGIYDFAIKLLKDQLRILGQRKDE